MKKPKRPKPTAAQQALQRQQVADLDRLKREENSRAKANRRRLGARESLLGGNELGVTTDELAAVAPTATTGARPGASNTRRRIAPVGAGRIKGLRQGVSLLP